MVRDPVVLYDDREQSEGCHRRPEGGSTLRDEIDEDRLSNNTAGATRSTISLSRLPCVADAERVYRYELFPRVHQSTP